MAKLDRGKLVVLFIFGVSFLAGGVAVWHLYHKGKRAKAFWGTETAVLIYHAPQVELLALDVDDEAPPDETVEEIRVEGKPRAVIDRRDITQTAGLIHVRGALIEDASFDWDKPRGPISPAWQYVLRFTDGDQQAALAVDLQCERVRLIGTDREVSVSPASAGIKELIERQLRRAESNR